MNSLQTIYLLLAISLGASFSRWGIRLTYPLRVFSTWIHECSHAVVATLLGASAVQITLASDGSGLTKYRMTPSRLRQSAIASAGYLGTTVAGCGIFYLAERRTLGPLTASAQQVLLGLAVLTALSLLIWIRNLFGFIAVTALTLAFVALSRHQALSHYSRVVLLFVGIQTALHALFDLRNLYRVGKSAATESDAQTLARLFFLPAGFWATLWLVMSVAFLYATLRSLSLIRALV